MSKVAEAVQALNGDIRNASEYYESATHLIRCKKANNGHNVGEYSVNGGECSPEYWETICTVDQFKLDAEATAKLDAALANPAKATPALKALLS